ncbi:MAG: 4-phosphoerythronate dehydrogenase [Alloprevotella sp.]|nr:4-phosphoerythronate dehydrogenase [Alloprevotella sp.]
MNLLIDDKIPYIRGQAERLGNCTYMPGTKITRKDVEGADVLIVRTRTRCDASLLSGSSVKLVVTATSGYDHLDTEFLDSAGIAWYNCPASNAMSVVQYVQTALLRLAHIGMVDLSMATVGIVGVGNVGSRLQKVLSQMGVRTLLCDPPRADKGEQGFMPLSDLVLQSDVITFHTPLTHKGIYATYHLADAKFFSLCAQKRPVIINAARGGVVDEALLKQALSDGTVRASVVDTWEGEPKIDAELLARCYIATPHIAGYSVDGKAKATRMALEAVAKWLDRDISFVVEPPAITESYRYNMLEEPFCPELRYYDPLYDTAIFKTYPLLFEQLRGSYPLRRESLLPV